MLLFSNGGVRTCDVIEGKEEVEIKGEFYDGTGEGMLVKSACQARGSRDGVGVTRQASLEFQR